MNDPGKINLHLTRFTRGEVVLAELLGNAGPDLTAWIFLKSTFKRPYADDITELEIKVLPGEEKLLCLLHRDGLYDLLPEGLFHQPYRLKHFKEVEDMLEEVKYQRQKQDEARKFFLPFEQELYRVRVQLEVQERSVFENDLRLHFAGLRQFWGIDPAIPLSEAQLRNILWLLPFAYRIAGDDALAARAFSLVLEAPVAIVRTPPRPLPAPPDGLAALGAMELGIDAVLGDALYDGMPGYRLAIGPLPASDLPAYLPGGEREPLLSLLEGYFLPVEAEVSRSLLAAPGERSFVTDTEETECLLGFTTYL